MKSPVWYLKYLINDLTGKDSAGRTAEEKKEYSTFIIYVSAALMLAGAILWFPWGAIPGGLLLARKLWLRFTNTF